MRNLRTDKSLEFGTNVDVCPACSANSEETIRIGKIPKAMHFCSFKYKHAINVSQLIECSVCGLAYKSPSLPINKLDELYSQQPAYIWGGETGNNSPRNDVSLVLQQIAKLNPRSKMILDIGCWDGSLLATLKKQFCEVKLYGIEPSMEAAQRASERGVIIIGKSFEDLKYSDHQFDVITLIDVFEHVLDIRSLFEIIINCVKPGGFLMIGTGAYDSNAIKIYKHRSSYISMPEHLTFFSKKCASWIANESNLKLVDYISYTHNTNRVVNVRYWTKRIVFYLTQFLPTWLFAMQCFRKLSGVRGAGIQANNISNDHALTVFRRKLKGN